jgi:hypothetical protein
VLVRRVGGWLSAFGALQGRRSRAETPSRSPLVALCGRWWPSTEYLFIALAGLGYTVATIETYKTFFFPNKPRGKFAGKPILFPELVRWRYQFAPLYAAIWLAVIVNLGVALREPRVGLLGEPSARGATLGAPLVAGSER